MTESFSGLEVRSSVEARANMNVRRDPFELAIAAFLADRYCSKTCTVRSILISQELVCPAMLIEKASSTEPIDTSEGLDMLNTVARNTWLHCVEDVKRGDEPVVLIDARG